MSQTTIEKEVCGACGADARPQAQFCYNCGGALLVAPAEKKSSLTPVTDASDATNASVINEETARTIDGGTVILVEKKDAKRSEIVKETVVEKTVVQETVKLRSAAALRKKSKSSEKKIVEYVWEEHENAPNVWFILAAILLATIAVCALILAMYLK